MEKFTFETLKIEPVSNHILIVTLNRPEYRNAINSQMMRDFRDLWQSLAVNETKIRCVILTGCGDQAFCAGADLKERLNLPLETWRQQHTVFEQAMVAMVDCPIPIIAAVNGAAFGGGLELTLASDFAYAASTAVFAQSETKIGIIPGAMGTQNLPRACGLRRAKELCFTAKTFSAIQAQEWGIVNEIYQQQDLMEHVLAVAKTIEKNAPIAIQEAKKALNFSEEAGIKSGFLYEISNYNNVLLTEDRKEGIQAFNEKRQPVFKGK